MADPTVRGDDDGRGDVFRHRAGVFVHAGTIYHEVCAAVGVAAHCGFREPDCCAYR